MPRRIPLLAILPAAVLFAILLSCNAGRRYVVEHDTPPDSELPYCDELPPEKQETATQIQDSTQPPATQLQDSTQPPATQLQDSTQPPATQIQDSTQQESQMQATQQQTVTQGGYIDEQLLYNRWKDQNAAAIKTLPAAWSDSSYRLKLRFSPYKTAKLDQNSTIKDCVAMCDAETGCAQVNYDVSGNSCELGRTPDATQLRASLASTGRLNTYLEDSPIAPYSSSASKLETVAQADIAAVAATIANDIGTMFVSIGNMVVAKDAPLFVPLLECKTNAATLRMLLDELPPVTKSTWALRCMLSLKNLTVDMQKFATQSGNNVATAYMFTTRMAMLLFRIMALRRMYLSTERQFNMLCWTTPSRHGVLKVSNSDIGVSNGGAWILFSIKDGSALVSADGKALSWDGTAAAMRTYVKGDKAFAWAWSDAVSDAGFVNGWLTNKSSTDSWTPAAVDDSGKLVVKQYSTNYWTLLGGAGLNTDTEFT